MSAQRLAGTHRALEVDLAARGVLSEQRPVERRVDRSNGKPASDNALDSEAGTIDGNTLTALHVPERCTDLQGDASRRPTTDH
jgi:hypothetical protein